MILWLIIGLIGYFLMKIYRRPLLDEFDLELDLVVLIFMCLGVVSLLAAAHFILKKTI
jgi:hypothetical protein